MKNVQLTEEQIIHLINVMEDTPSIKLSKEKRWTNRRLITKLIQELSK
tara:strand:+ start:803 stop:946 length:144 start_codon:yes stop_codon:yes gene_type:complete